MPHLPFATASPPITSVAKLVQVARRLRTRAGSLPVWYRGLTRADRFLLPSIARGDYSLSDEHTLTNNFKKNAIPFVERRPTSEWEWLFLMRHHDVPTRLLDWSESAPVGLFFATHSLAAPDKNDEYDGALWVLLPTRLNRDAGISFPLSHDLPMFEDDDRHMTNYTPSQLALESTSHLRPAAALAVRQSRRMEMQHSVFTVSHRDLQPLEDVTSEDTLCKYTIPAKAKPTLRAQLDALGFSRLTLFPDLDNVGQAARKVR